jgi:hypothetical protein
MASTWFEDDAVDSIAHMVKFSRLLSDAVDQAQVGILMDRHRLFIGKIITDDKGRRFIITRAGIMHYLPDCLWLEGPAIRADGSIGKARRRRVIDKDDKV